MHVCHLSDTSLEGDYFRNIIAGLRQKGVRLSLMQLAPGSPPSWLEQFPDVAFTSLNASTKLQYPFAVRRLAQTLQNNRVDILHTHLFFSGAIGVLSKKLRPTTIVAIMRHHTSVVRMLGSRIHIMADIWMAGQADHVLTVSEAARDYMREVDGITRPIDVIHLGFDFEKYRPNADDRKQIRAEFGLEDQYFVIGYAANMIEGKGHKELIAAFEIILAEIPDARLLLLGRVNQPEMEANAASLPRRSVVFAGWRTDVPACLNAMDLFVQPSLSEAFSQVLVEAMGVGLPVVATDVGGAREVIDNGVNGIIVPPGDPAAIAREVVNLYKDPTTCELIGERGRRTVTDRFTVPQMVDRHMRLYKSWMN